MISLDLIIKNSNKVLYNMITNYINKTFTTLDKIDINKDSYFSIIMENSSDLDNITLIKPFLNKTYLSSVKINSKFYPILQINILDDSINFNLKITSNIIKYEWIMDIIQSKIIDLDTFFLAFLEDIENIRHSLIENRIKLYETINPTENLNFLNKVPKITKYNIQPSINNNITSDINSFQQSYDKLILECVENHKKYINLTQNKKIGKSVTIILDINKNNVQKLNNYLNDLDINYNLYINSIDDIEINNKNIIFMKGNIVNNFNLLVNQKLNDIVIFLDNDNLDYLFKNIKVIIEKFTQREFLGIIGTKLEEFSADIPSNKVFFSILENRNKGIIIGTLPKKLDKLKELQQPNKIYYNTDFNFSCSKKILKSIKKENFKNKEEILKTISIECYNNNLSIKYLEE